MSAKVHDHSPFAKSIADTLTEIVSLRDSLSEIAGTINRIAELPLNVEQRKHVEKNLRSFLDRLRSSRATVAYREAAAAFRSFHAGLL